MVRRVALIALLFAPAAAAQEPAPVPAPEWTPAGVSVGKPDPNDDQPLAFRNVHGTTTLTADLRLPGRFLLALNPAESVIVRFTDDRNTDLAAVAAAAPRPPPALRMVSGAAVGNGKTMRVTFHSQGYPVAGATKLRLKGVVGVLIGRDEKTAELKDVSVRTGIDLAGGKLKANAGTGTPPALATFTGPLPVTKLVVLDPAGREVEVPRSSGSAAWVGAPKGQFSRLYSWPRTAPDPCTVRATYFDRVVLAKVPVELEVGLGL